MKTISKAELQERIKLHEAWLRDKPQGKRLVLIDHDLSGSDISGSDISYSNLSGSNLHRSDLRGSDLRGSDLSYSNLHRSNLSYSDLRDSDLRDSDLSGSNLSYSNLHRSDLRDSDLRDSDLRDSDLRNCTGNMREVKSLHFDNWIVTYTDTILNIGCQSHPIEEWFKFDDETISNMDTEALTWWRKYRDILKQIIGVSNAAH